MFAKSGSDQVIDFAFQVFFNGEHEIICLGKHVLLTWFDIILDLTSMLSLRGGLHGVNLNAGTLLLSIYRS